MPNLASSEILRGMQHRVNENLSGHDTELCYEKCQQLRMLSGMSP